MDVYHIGGTLNDRGIDVTYDTQGRIVQTEDRAHRLNTITYDAWGKVATVLGPSYVASGTTYRDQTTVVSYERTSLPGVDSASVARPGRRLVADDIRTTVTDQRGRVTSIWFDEWAAPRKVTDAVGYTATTSRNAFGQVSAVNDGHGNTTSYGWQGANLVSVTTAQGTVNYEYGPRGQVSHVYGVGPETRTYFMDGFDLPTHSVTGADTTWFGYGPEQRLSDVTDPEHHTTHVEFEASGFKNTQSVTAAGRTTSFAYDGYGRQISQTSSGRTNTVGYDPMNRTAWTALGNDTTVYTWGLLFLNQVRDPKGQIYSWTRNEMGWATEEQRPGDPGSAHLLTAYDRYGRVASTTNRRGQSVTFTYDQWDRVASRVADGQGAAFSYSPINPAQPTADSWVAVAYGMSTDTIRYDSKGRVIDNATRRYVPGVATPPQAIHIVPRYDENSLRVGLAIEGPAITRDSLGYGHDENWRLSRIWDWANATTTLGYNGDGALSSTTLPTGQRIDRDYTASHQTASITIAGLEGGSYQYDALNRLIQRYDVGESHRRNLAYDARGMLQSYADYTRTGSTKPTCTFDPNLGEVCTDAGVTWSAPVGRSYAYDRVGNPADAGVVMGGGNRVAQMEGYSLVYDNDGNITRKYNASGFDQTLTWNTLGQLTGVTTISGGQTTTVTYQYDGFGRRVGRNCTAASTCEQYLYDGDDRVMDLDGWNAAIARYSYLPGIDRPHSVTRGGQTYYIGQDQQGSVEAVISQTGSIVATYDYDPWGRITSSAGNGQMPFRYTGREYDEASGIYYYRNRWYDPALRRFISEDPIGLLGGTNPYAYVENDPANAIDPYGLFSDAGPEKCDEGVHPSELGTEGWGITGCATASGDQAWLDFLNSGQSDPLNPYRDPPNPPRDPSGGPSGPDLPPPLPRPGCGLRVAEAAISGGLDLLTIAGVGLAARGVEMGTLLAAKGLASRATARAINRGAITGLGMAYTLNSNLINASMGDELNWRDFVPFWGTYRAVQAARRACRRDDD